MPPGIFENCGSNMPLHIGHLSPISEITEVNVISQCNYGFQTSLFLTLKIRRFPCFLRRIDNTECVQVPGQFSRTQVCSNFPYIIIKHPNTMLDNHYI